MGNVQIIYTPKCLGREDIKNGTMSLSRKKINFTTIGTQTWAFPMGSLIVRGMIFPLIPVISPIPEKLVMTSAISILKHKFMKYFPIPSLSH